MTKMKLYRVDVSKQLLVYAEDPREAERIAEYGVDEDIQEWVCWAREVKELAPHEVGCLVHHSGREDIKAEEALSAKDAG